MLHACEILFSGFVRARILALPNKAKVWLLSLAEVFIGKSGPWPPFAQQNHIAIGPFRVLLVRYSHQGWYFVSFMGHLYFVEYDQNIINHMYV